MYFSDSAYDGGTSQGGGGNQGGDQGGGSVNQGGNQGGDSGAGGQPTNDPEDDSDDGLNPFSGSASGDRTTVFLETYLLKMENGITLSIDGLDASNYNKFVDFESPTRMLTNFGHNYSADEISVQFSVDYKLLVFSLTNVGAPTRGDASYMRFFYGATSTSNTCNFHFAVNYNTTDSSIVTILNTSSAVTISGIGEFLPDVRSGNRDGLLISPPYLRIYDDSISAYVKSHQWQWWKKSNNVTYRYYGPRWTFPIYDVTPINELSKYSNHRYEDVDGSGINASMAATWTRDGVRYKLAMADRFLWN